MQMMGKWQLFQKMLKKCPKDMTEKPLIMQKALSHLSNGNESRKKLEEDKRFWNHIARLV